jgi:putative FmdB family regulatory protein
MPTYQYACRNAECGNRFELVQSFSDPAASVCPVCGGEVRKVFSSVGVVFKGSGFYRTDSRSDATTGAKKPAAVGASDSTSDSGSSSASSDSSTKPATAASSSGSSGTTGIAAASA